jgi:pimeloyl-ACP methyl ester carboxylesterase
MVPCTFMDKGNCTGLVHGRFQEAFTELMTACADALEVVRGKMVLVGGHSLGGAFTLMMLLKLWKDYDTVAALGLGIAGPFVGDEAFTQVYLPPFQAAIGDRWYQLETVDVDDPSNFDGTVGLRGQLCVLLSLRRSPSDA